MKRILRPSRGTKLKAATRPNLVCPLLDCFNHLECASRDPWTDNLRIFVFRSLDEKFQKLHLFIFPMIDPFFRRYTQMEYNIFRVSQN